VAVAMMEKHGVAEATEAEAVVVVVVGAGGH
jgi:hypothetical protein